MKPALFLTLIVNLAWLILGIYWFYDVNASELAFTADSGYYVTVAYGLKAHQGFTHHGDFWTVFPPLYSLLLSLSGSSLAPNQFAPLLHAALFGILLFAISLQQGRMSKRTFLVNLCIPLLVLFSPVFEVSSFLWSEELYIVLTTLMFVLLCGDQQSISLPRLIALGVVTGLAPISRYIGVVNIVTATVSLAFILRGRWWSRILTCAAFGFVTIIPVAVWCFRNYSIDGTLFGVRPPTNTSLADNLYHSWVTFSGWFEPIDNGWITILWIVIPVVAYLMLRVRMSLPLQKCFHMALFIGTYVAFLNVSVSKNLVDPIGTRFLSPVYVPLALLLGLIFKTSLSHGSNVTRAIAIATLILLIGNNTLRFGRQHYDAPKYRHDLLCKHTYRPPPSMNCPPGPNELTPWPQRAAPLTGQ